MEVFVDTSKSTADLQSENIPEYLENDPIRQVGQEPADMCGLGVGLIVVLFREAQGSEPEPVVSLIVWVKRRPMLMLLPSLSLHLQSHKHQISQMKTRFFHARRRDRKQRQR